METEIEAIRPFNRTAQGELCEPGDVFSVTETRAGELERLGLARRTKAAPKPSNKMAAEPENKAEKAPRIPQRKQLPVTPEA